MKTGFYFVDLVYDNVFYILAILGFIVVVLFKVNSPVQRFVKMVVFSGLVTISSFIMIPLLLRRPKNTLNVKIAARIFSFFLSIFNIEYEVDNPENFENKGPYIVINNHQSTVDFLTMMRIWPGGNLSPLAKKELKWMGPFGAITYLCGITFIDRLNPERSRKTIDDLAVKINRENLRVWIYPEGTRNAKTLLLPLKKGAFHLAIQAQVPIVCVVTSSYLNFDNKKENKFLNSGKVKLRVFPAYETKGLTVESVNELTEHFQQFMQSEFDKLNKEMDLDPKYNTGYYREHKIVAKKNATVANGDEIKKSS